MDEKKYWVDHTLWGKPIWSWLKLISILLVPVVLALGTWALSAAQDRAASDRHDNDQKISERNQQDTSLNSYREIVVNFLVDKNLLNAKDGDPVRMSMVELTRNEVRILDDEHKGYLVSFLSDLGLLARSEDHPVPIGSLKWDDLRGANLEVDNLDGADLRDANLTGAHVTPDELSRTWALAGTILPDGTVCSKANDWSNDNEQTQIKASCINHYKQSYLQNPQKYKVTAPPAG